MGPRWPGSGEAVQTDHTLLTEEVRPHAEVSGGL